MPNEKMDRELAELIQKLHRMKQELAAAQQSADEIQTSIDQLHESARRSEADRKAKGRE